MNVYESRLKGSFILQPKIFKDERGCFFESFNVQKFEDATGLNGKFVQDNQSISSYGVIRGLHYQSGEYSQAKLVRVIEGRVWDVAVDLRMESESFGQWHGVELSDENNLQFYIPRGFAHGFSVLSETATFVYKCDNEYNKEYEGGIRYDDPTLNIDWKVPKSNMILSDKDLALPYLTNIK